MMMNADEGGCMNEIMVETKGLTKEYQGYKAVDGLNLSIPAGGVYGLLGPNGAGKSTTMKLLLGLTAPTSGRIWMCGGPVDGKHRVAPGLVGSLIEGPSFYPGLTGLDNCRMIADYLGLPANRAAEVLAWVGLKEQENKKAKDYSLGMKQRLGIAMALISHPELLLLDEPTNGLDAAAVVEVREMIMDLARREGVTVIVSSHILSEIEKMAPMVGIIASGRLLYQGSLDRLRDAGHIAVRVADPEGAAGLLRGMDMQYRYIPQSDIFELPQLPDAEIGGLVAALAARGNAVYRVASVQKSLEQAFLELIEGVQTGQVR
jgi:lantibiotic transport system ATP-binding protein